MLTLDEIKAVFDSWRQQAQVNEEASRLWNALYDDLEMAVKAKQRKAPNGSS